MKKEICVVFDLDDTLYKEIDFVYSGFKQIAKDLGIDCSHEMLENFHNGKNAFHEIINKYKLSVDVNYLLNIYRNHIPTLTLEKEVKDVLDFLVKKVKYLGLVTDGRSISQRNKLSALGITNYFSEIIISEEIGSEKPNLKNFASFLKYRMNTYFYIGDNVNKDFITPNKLGWETVQLINNGKNIIRNIGTVSLEMKPNFQIDNFNQLVKLIYDK